MAQDQNIVECPVGEWTQLTNADVTAITFQVRSGVVEIAVTTGTTAPANGIHGARYSDGEGEANVTLTDIWSLATADRVWARPIGSQDATVWVDHA